MAGSHGLSNLRVSAHPLLATLLTRLRDTRTPSFEFRGLVARMAAILTVEATRDMPTREVEVQTPLERTTGRVVAGPVTVVPILRAGLGMTDGALSILPDARVGHLGFFRDEESLAPVPYFKRLPPDVSQGPVIVVDPMIATGGTATRAVDALKESGCRDIRFLCVVCAPTGVTRMRERHPEVMVHAASLDRQLDTRGYILPGLGDAGDRTFGTV